MKIRAALIVVVAALTGCQQKPFAPYESVDGKFKGIFPGEPKVSTASAAGVTLKLYTAESWNKVYMMAWADMPIPDWESETRTKSRLFDARDGALAAIKGKSNGTTKTIALAERFPGIEFGGMAEGKHLRARAYLVGHRMYQLLVASRAEEHLTAQEAEDFFAAFEVIEPESLLPKGSASSDPLEPVSRPSHHAIKSSSGRFLAKYPEKPKKTLRTIGGTAFTGYASESAKGTCCVEYADLPIPGGESAERIAQRLDAARNAVISQLKGTSSSSKDIALGAGKPGREFSADAEGKHIRGRVYLIGARLYQITVFGSEEYLGSPEATAFLDSFRLSS
jgi:hypothetical protein